MKKILGCFNKESVKNKAATAGLFSFFKKMQGTKLCLVIKKIIIWFGTVITAIFAVLFISECGSNKTKDTVIKDDTEEINAKACKKREETLARINNASARSIAEQYGSVCDTITEGKDRFRKRCTRTDD